MSTGKEFEALEINTLSQKKIFSEKTRFQGKKSNVRYSNGKENAEPGLNPPSRPSHRRSGSHHRQQSIYFPPETALDTVISSLKPPEKCQKHRNLSDADSVIFLGPSDQEVTKPHSEATEKKSEFQLSIVETATGSLLSTEKPPVSPRKKQMPCLGNTATTSFCRFCKRDVHTKVEFNSCYNSKLLTAFSSLIGCCSYPNWMASYIVHKCPNCSLVLGKSR
jgi:hypothetical protein